MSNEVIDCYGRITPASLYIATLSDSIYTTYYIAETAGNTIATTSPGINYAYCPIVNAARTRMYCTGVANVGYIDLATDTWTAFAGLNCGNMVLDSTETYLYTISAVGIGRFEKIRISDGVVVDFVTGLGNANVVCISDDDSIVYLIGHVGAWHTYDTASEVMTARADMYDGGGVALSIDNATLYASANDLIHGAGSYLQIFNATTYARIGDITLPSYGRKLACHPNGLTVAVCCTSTTLNEVWIISIASGLVTHTITVGGGNHELCYNGEGTRLYVSNDISDTVSVIDVNPASANLNTVIATIVPAQGVNGGIFIWPKA